MIFEEEFKELQKQYLENLLEKVEHTEGLLLQIENGEKGAFKTLLSEIHTIKGTAGTYGFSFLTTLCHNFEDELAQQSFSEKLLIDKNLQFIDLMKDFTNKAWQQDCQIDSGPYDERLAKLLGKDGTDKTRKYLIVENMKTLLKSYVEVLKQNNCQYSIAKDGYEALGRIINEDFEGIITTYETGKINGEALSTIVRNLSSIPKDFKFILVTSRDLDHEVQTADCILKKSPQLPNQIADFIQSN